MKKALLPLIAVSLIGLCGCTESSAPVSSASSSSSSSVSGGLTLGDVIDSFGTNLTVNSIFKFFDSTKNMVKNDAYVEKGCYTKYTNFTSGFSNYGLIDLADGVYKWSDPTKDTLTLGEKIDAASSFRDIFYEPSQLKDDKASYLSAFVPEIAGASNGYFTLNKTGGQEVLLEKFVKCLGVYDTIVSLSGMELNYVRLYFAAKTTTYTISVYSNYQGGYGGFETAVTVSKIGSTAIKAITDYLAA